jgi:hypothetical protein
LFVAGSVPESEIQQAEEKFEESRQLAEAAMHNLIENEVVSRKQKTINRNNRF